MFESLYATRTLEDALMDTMIAAISA